MKRATALLSGLRPWPCLAALLGLALLIELLPASGGGPARLALPAPTGAAPVPSDPDAWQRTVVTRPLFDPSRRATGFDSAQTALPRLSAILIGPGQASAIFAAAGQKPQIVQAGGEVAGDKVESIGAGGVVLITATGPVTLRPRFATNAGAAAPALPPPTSRQPADSSVTAGPYDNE